MNLGIDYEETLAISTKCAAEIKELKSSINNSSSKIKNMLKETFVSGMDANRINPNFDVIAEQMASFADELTLFNECLIKYYNLIKEIEE